MCHYCIGILISRRNRAEKRRLEKLGVVDVDAALWMNRPHHVIAETKQLIPGKEFECVVEQSRQLADLVELLKDAKARLESLVHTSTANKARPYIDPA